MRLKGKVNVTDRASIDAMVADVKACHIINATERHTLHAVVRHPGACANMPMVFVDSQPLPDSGCKRLRTSTIAGVRSAW